MARLYFILGLQFILTCVLCGAHSLSRKRFQKCQEYSENVFGDAVPTCGTSTSSIQKISMREFPHIAILGSRENDDPSSFNWWCHGTLVSSRYVLTIAHCIQNSRTTITKVRLGATETLNSDKSSSFDYDIESIILHPLYKRYTYYNHLGLIQLSRQVEFSENIRPICLPESDISTEILYQVSYEGSKNIIDGSSESVNLKPKPLTKYQHALITNADCNERLTSLGIHRQIRDGITDQLMCSSKPENLSAEYNGRDESAAPWFIDHPMVNCSHIQLGILLFSFPGEANLPDAATKVFSFVDWIESIIWAEGEDF